MILFALKLSLTGVCTLQYFSTFPYNFKNSTDIGEAMTIDYWVDYVRRVGTIPESMTR